MKPAAKIMEEKINKVVFKHQSLRYISNVTANSEIDPQILKIY